MIGWPELLKRAELLYPDIQPKRYDLKLWPDGPVGHGLQFIWNALEVAESLPGARVLVGYQKFPRTVEFPLFQHHAAVLDSDGTAWEVTHNEPFDFPFIAIPVKPKLLRRWGLTASVAQAKESAEMHETAAEFEERCNTVCVVRGEKRRVA